MALSRRLFLALGAISAFPASRRAAAREPDGIVLRTISDLRTLSTNGLDDGTVRQVLGYATLGDGGGGWFRWEVEAQSRPDQGTVFDTEAGDAGRWVRVVEGDWRGEWFGLRADGASDNAAVLSRAIDAAAGRVLLLPKGTIRIGGALEISAASYHLRGQQPERGQYGRNTGTTIDASGIGRGKWLVERFDVSPPLEDTIGPFTHENLDIRLGEANGFAFGRADLDGGSLVSADYDPVRDRGGQKYVHGVQFTGCRITGAIARYGSDARGRIARSGQRLIFLTKCFESRIENCSLVGGDVQIETWGCDAPLIRNVRSNNSHLPIHMRRSGWFGVSHRLSELQCESFTFGAVVSDGVMLEASNLRFEPNVAGDTRGVGRFDLTDAIGATARVAADEDTMEMSHDMTGVLFPGLSLIELSDGADNNDLCLVTGVDGRRVTIWSEGFSLTWSTAAARLVRVHGYGLMHGGAHDATIVGGHPDPFRDCPAFVYRAEHGSMYIAAVGKVPGSNGDVRSRVLGNIYRRPSPARRMAFAACSPFVAADPAHPFVASVEDRATRLEPGSHVAVGLPFNLITGPPGGPVRIAAWLLRPGAAFRVPAAGDARRVKILARSVGDAATLRVGSGRTMTQLSLWAPWTEQDLVVPESGVEITSDGPALIARIMLGALN